MRFSIYQDSQVGGRSSNQDRMGYCFTREALLLMLADGNCAYTKALDLTLDASGFGMGTRGQRFAIVVKNGVVSHLFVEAPMEFKVSAAEHVLANL